MGNPMTTQCIVCGGVCLLLSYDGIGSSIGSGKGLVL